MSPWSDNDDSAEGMAIAGGICRTGFGSQMLAKIVKKVKKVDLTFRS